jgi:hypothetical protein
MKETDTSKTLERHNYRIRGVVNGAFLGLCVGFPVVVRRIFPEAAGIATASMIAPILCPIKWIKEDLKKLRKQR